MLTDPKRLLVVAAHPGDADRAIGGSVALWTSRGTQADLACLTSGDGGSDDTAADPLREAARREAEQRAAASSLGYRSVQFLHRPEGALVNDLALREQLVRVIRALRPDTIAAPDPRVIVTSDGQIQPIDHREAGLAAIDAAYPAATRAMAFPHLVSHEQLLPHSVSRLLLYWPAEADVVMDVTASLDAKLEAMRAHVSDPESSGRMLTDARETLALVTLD